MSINIIPNRDSEGNEVVHQVLAGDGKYFKPRIMTFKVGKYKSLFNKNSELTDLGDCELKFFDGDFTELTKGESETDDEFQDRLALGCRHTWMFFTPTSEYDAKLGQIMRVGYPSGDLIAWFEQAPHIPKSYGGSVACIDGGIPLHLFPEKEWLIMDGGTCADIALDTEYYSHRVGVKIFHELDEDVDIIILFGIYRE